MGEKKFGILWKLDSFASEASHVSKKLEYCTLKIRFYCERSEPCMTKKVWNSLKIRFFCEQSEPGMAKKLGILWKLDSFVSMYMMYLPMSKKVWYLQQYSRIFKNIQGY